MIIVKTPSEWDVISPKVNIKEIHKENSHGFTKIISIP